MQRIFQISMVLLVSLTGLTAAIAEGFPISAFSMPLAFATWYFIDLTGVFSLPRWVQPVLGLVAFGAAGAEYLSIPGVSYLSVGNHLLAYLTWVFLLQRKDERTYWALFALNVLQIAVTALLTFSVWFGVALLAFMLLATWTLSVFLLYRSVESLNRDEDETGSSGRSATARSGSGRVWSGVSREPNERLVTPRFCGNSFVMTGFAFGIAALFFLFIPRIWSGQRTALGGKGNAPLTGFSTEVRLGDMGEILESKDHVMEVRVFDAQSSVLLAPALAHKVFGSEPLFRGAVLEEYEQGRWQRPQFKVSRRMNQGIDQSKYRLRIDLSPINAETIFSFGNTLAATTTKPFGSISWDYFSNELNRGEETDLDREFSYDLYIDDGPPDLWLSQQRTLELDPYERFDPDNGFLTPMSERKFRQNLASLTRLPSELNDLYAITDRVIAGAQTPLEKAQKIIEWLTASGEFEYTMKLSVSNSSIDPILDFLENRKKGHCEYFASSMATMLRCAQIPSRVITGFKGGVFNSKLNTLRVQQFHAHAWVEAYIDDRWHTFDPTPGERDEQVQSIEGRPSSFIRSFRNLESVWHRFSIMSKEGQEEKIYQPLKARFEQIRHTAQELLQGRTSSLKSMAAFFTTPERWLSIEGGIVAILFVMLILSISWLIRRLYQASRTLQEYLKLQAAAAAGRAPQIAFYERLLAILRAHGLTPRPSQTAREFIDDALLQLEPQLAIQGFAAIPQSVVDRFYRVRYGREVLKSAEVQELEQSLKKLETCLQEKEEQPA